MKRIKTNLLQHADLSDLRATRANVSGVSYYACGIQNTEQVVALVGLVGAGDDEESAANARHIVACLRACAGIETRTLEFFGEKINKEMRSKNQLAMNVTTRDQSILDNTQKAIAITMTIQSIAKAQNSSRA